LGPATFSKEDEAKSKIFVKIAQKYNQYAFAKDIHPIPINVKAVRYLAEPTFDNYGNVIPSHEHEAKALKTLLSTDKSPTLLRGAVLTTLLTLGQFDVLDEAVRFIDTTQQIPLAQKNVQISDEAAGLAQTIRFVNGAKYIPDLGNLLQNKNLEVRRSAITALANFVYQSTPFGKPMINLKDSVTLPFLIKALDDSDSEVRHRALRALPRATNKPSWDPPRLPTGYLDIAPKEEQKLIAQWKQWWKSEGSKAFDALPK
jgi:hypothetical protein